MPTATGKSPATTPARKMATAASPAPSKPATATPKVRKLNCVATPKPTTAALRGKPTASTTPAAQKTRPATASAGGARTFAKATPARPASAATNGDTAPRTAPAKAPRKVLSVQKPPDIAPKRGGSITAGQIEEFNKRIVCSGLHRKATDSKRSTPAPQDATPGTANTRSASVLTTQSNRDILLRNKAAAESAAESGGYSANDLSTSASKVRGKSAFYMSSQTPSATAHIVPGCGRPTKQVTAPPPSQIVDEKELNRVRSSFYRSNTSVADSHIKELLGRTPTTQYERSTSTLNTRTSTATCMKSKVPLGIPLNPCHSKKKDPKPNYREIINTVERYTRLHTSPLPKRRPASAAY